MSKDDLQKDASNLDKDTNAAIHSGPALYSNKFFVTVGTPGVRISFTEQYDAEVAPAFRTAVLLSHEDSIEFYKLLQKLLADVEKQLEEHKKKNG